MLPCHHLPRFLTPNQRGEGLPSFQWKMAVVNFMNQAFLWPQDTLKDQYRTY